MPSLDRALTPRIVLGIVRRRAPVVIVCVLVAVGAALTYSLASQKQYTATAALVFNSTPLSQQIAGLQPSSNNNTPSQQDTNLQLLKLGNMAQEAARRVGHGLTKNDVINSLAISPTGDTTIVNVASTLPSAALATQVANTYARIFVNQQENGDHQYYQSALATLERQIANLPRAEAKGAQGLSLQNRAQSLATLAQIRTGTVSLAQAATVPTSPSSPAVKRNVIIAGLLGLLLGAGLGLLMERLDQNIRDPSELEGTYGLPLLGLIPFDPALRRDDHGSQVEQPPSAVADAFQFIRARLKYFNVDRDVHTVAIVSSEPEDGKTTIAHWLANAAARMGSRVLLIETDLRRPTVAQEIGLNTGPGLADILIGGKAVDDATQSVVLHAASVSNDNERLLDVIVAGGMPPNPAEMLESRAMADVLKRAKATYDFVVIDTPPLGTVSDALPLVRAVDGVVIVAQMGRSRRDTAQRLKSTLASVDAPLLGVIANRVRSRDIGYSYGYGYSGNGAKQSSKLISGEGPSEAAADTGDVRGEELAGRAPTGGHHADS